MSYWREKPTAVYLYATSEGKWRGSASLGRKKVEAEADTQRALVAALSAKLRDWVKKKERALEKLEREVGRFRNRLFQMEGTTIEPR